MPKGWEYERLRNIFIINPKNQICDNTEISFIPMALIEDKYSGKYSYEIKKWSLCKKGFTHFSIGDVAFAKISPCFENRKSTLFTNLKNGYGAGTTELYVLRRFNEDILPTYLLYFVKSEYFINRGKGTFSGVVGQQRLDKETILNTLVPIPPKNSQNRIIDVLHQYRKILKEIEDSLI